MSGDRADGAPVSATLSESTVTWLDDRARELGLTREEFLDRLLTAHQHVDEGDHPAPATAAELATLRSKLTTLNEEFEKKLRDVRERVVQVKRESDAKAPADHDHPELAAQQEDTARETGQLAAELSELDAELASLAERVETMQAHLDAGFENYEDILEYLTETADEQEARLGTTARAVVGMRTAVQTLAARAEAAAAVDELAERANSQGIHSADCDECGRSVDVALLRSPTCPHCGATFTDVEPKRGFFGSPSLVVGSRPALEAGETPRNAVDELLEEEDLESMLDE